MANKPWGITLNVILLAISGILMLLTAIGISIGAGMAWVGNLLPVAGILTFVLAFTFIVAIVILALAYFLWEGYSIAWWLLVILITIGLIGNIASLVFMTAFPLISIVIETFLLLSLLHKDTIAYIKPNIDYRGWELED